MAMWDLHVHCDLSFDGESKLSEICERAVALGLTGFALTDHVDYDDIRLGLYPPYDWEEARRQVEQARKVYGDRVTILRGVELGQAHLYTDEVKDFLKKGEFDYVLASLHNLEGAPDFSCFKFSEMPPNEILYWLTRYYNEQIEIAKAIDADAFGHITYPLRYCFAEGVEADLTPLLPKIGELYDILIRKHIALEVNVSGLRKAWKTTMPDAPLIALYKEHGGREIAVGSDAHHAKDLALHVPETVEALEKEGFILRNRLPDPREKGI